MFYSISFSLLLFSLLVLATRAKYFSTCEIVFLDKLIHPSDYFLVFFLHLFFCPFLPGQTPLSQHFVILTPTTAWPSISSAVATDPSKQPAAGLTSQHTRDLQGYVINSHRLLLSRRPAAIYLMNKWLLARLPGHRFLQVSEQEENSKRINPHYAV